MKEIEPGYYHFRVTGLDKQDEMLVVTSSRSFVSGYNDLRKQQKDFLAQCKNARGIIDPTLTHTVFDPNQKEDRWDYLALCDLNSDH